MTTDAVNLMPKIQAKVKAPKMRTNDFGKFDYRKAEDILEVAKPVLGEFKASIILGDFIELIGDRYYVKASAKIVFPDTSIMESIAYAREPVSKKGMDESQITGAASSYARKYALNGLFALDDGRDPDNEEPPEPIGEAQAEALQAMIDKLDEEEQEGFNVWMHDNVEVDTIHELDLGNVKKVEGILKAKIRQKAKQ